MKWVNGSVCDESHFIHLHGDQLTIIQPHLLFFIDFVCVCVCSPFYLLLAFGFAGSLSLSKSFARFSTTSNAALYIWVIVVFVCFFFLYLTFFVGCYCYCYTFFMVRWNGTSKIVYSICFYCNLSDPSISVACMLQISLNTFYLHQ